MKYRKLRIAWSVVWGVACVLVIVFWVRGEQHYIDAFMVPLSTNEYVKLESSPGAIWLFFQEGHLPTWEITHEHQEYWNWGFPDQPFPSDFVLSKQGVRIPCWMLLVGLTSMTAIPWLPWRFSLRTLLIVTTLIAVGLGLIAYLTHEIQ